MAILPSPELRTTYDGQSPMERREAVRNDRLARYERMVEIRMAEAKIRDLLSEGLAWGSTHNCDGQEAVAVGIAAALPPTDLVIGSHRGHGLGLAMGLSPEALIGEILGRECGAVGGLGGTAHLTETSIGLLYTVTLMGAGVPIATGVALASDTLDNDTVSLCVFGDGAVNIGAFHEGLNLAAVWNLPAVFIIENNHYGEYSRFDKTTPIPVLAARGAAYGMPWELVDGQDADLVAAKVAEAAERARSGGGPTLLELRTYRYLGHNRTDQALYRPEGELEEWLARDPITIMRDRLEQEGAMDAETADAIDRRCRERIDAAAAFALDSPEPGPEAMFRFVEARSRR